MRPNITFFVLLAVLSSGVQAAKADTPIVDQIHTVSNGQTYGQWAAEWWQWALGVPAPTNPLLDTTGEFCGQRQVGNVWFLAGSFETDPVVRECNVPRGKALFFPLVNVFYGAFLNDPPEFRTEDFVRDFGTCPFPVSGLSVVVDGFAIPNPERFFTGEGGSRSPLFNVQLPPDNVFGVDETVIPELVLSPVAEEGYYILLRPMSPGNHTIQIAAQGCFEGFSQDITYNLTVADD